MLSKFFIYFHAYLTRPYLWFDLLRQPYRLIQLSRKREKLNSVSFCQNSLISLSEAIDTIKVLASSDSEINDYNFTTQDLPSHFPGGANPEFLYVVVRLLQPSIVIETGVGFGISSSAILTALHQNNFGHLYSIDRPAFLNDQRDADVGSAVHNSLYSRWSFIRGVDRDHLPRLFTSLSFNGPLVFHYDSDKSYFGRYWAFNLAYCSIPSGSLIISDDSSDNMAFFDFCKLYSLTPFTVYYNAKYLSFTFVS